MVLSIVKTDTWIFPYTLPASHLGLEWLCRFRWGCTGLMGKTYSTAIVGESHYQRAIHDGLEGEVAFLVHEPDNKYDDRAVRVETESGATIGYLEKGSWIGRVIIDEQKDVQATIERVTGKGKKTRGIVLAVQVGGDGKMPLRVAATKGDDDAVDPRQALKTAGGCLVFILLIIGWAAILA